MVKNYFISLEEQISLFQNIIQTYSIKTKYYSSNKGYIAGDIIFANNSKLSFKEVKDTEFYRKDKYSYNYMGISDKMIFRYDNAYHHPEIESFPHHKHLPTGIKKSNEPELIDILIEISKYLEKPKNESL